MVKEQQQLKQFTKQNKKSYHKSDSKIVTIFICTAFRSILYHIRTTKNLFLKETYENSFLFGSLSIFISHCSMVRLLS